MELFVQFPECVTICGGELTLRGGIRGTFKPLDMGRFENYLSLRLYYLNFFFFESTRL